VDHLDLGRTAGPKARGEAASARRSRRLLDHGKESLLTAARGTGRGASRGTVHGRPHDRCPAHGRPSARAGRPSYGRRGRSTAGNTLKSVSTVDQSEEPANRLHLPEECLKRARPIPPREERGLGDDITDEEWEAFQKALAGTRVTPAKRASLMVDTQWS
jgi:hypothetical protein